MSSGLMGMSSGGPPQAPGIKKEPEHAPVHVRNADEVRKMLKESQVDSIKCIDAGINEKDAATFSEILRQQPNKCTELFLGANEIMSEGAAKLVETMKFKVNLRKLDLAANDICKKGAEEIAETLKLPLCTLVMLNLSYNCIEDEGAQKIGEALKAKAGGAATQVGQNSKSSAEPLKELNLRMNGITADGVERLCDALREPQCHLTSLNLSANKLDEKGGERIADALKWNTTLSSLDVSGSIQEPNVGNKGVEHIAHVLRMPNPSRQLSGGDLKQDHFQMHHLNLSFNDISDDVGAILAQELKFNYKLRHLVLRGNCLADSSGKAFAEMMCLNSVLKEIDLSLNLLGVTSGIQLAEMMKANKGLLHVNLSANKIGGKYVTNESAPGKVFAEAVAKCKSLQSLDLGGCGFEASEEQSINEEAKKKNDGGVPIRVNLE